MLTNAPLLRSRVWTACLAIVLVAGALHAQTTPASRVLPPSRQVLSAEQIASLEEKLKTNPEDDATRMQLIANYGRDQFRSTEARSARQRHVLWMIEHRPNAELASPDLVLHARLDGSAYDEGKRLWEKHLEANPQDVTILTRAAQYFLLDERGRAEALLLQAEKLEPTNPRWPERLAHLYNLDANRPGGVDVAAAKKALAAMERAKALATDDGFNLLVSLAKMALAAEEREKARDYATRLLQQAPEHVGKWNYGNAIHDGNSVLGRLALREGKMQEAKTFLLNAGKTPGSPQLNSFGPDIALAAELLEKGEKEAVLAYFELCRGFWKMGGERLDAWTQAVKENRTPEFGANRRR